MPSARGSALLGTAVAAAALLLGCALRWHRRRRGRARGPEELLHAVGRRSKGVLYAVSNKTNDAFSIPNLTSYLRTKGVAIHAGATAEETITVNAERLLQLLDSAGTRLPRSSARLRHALVSGVVHPDDLKRIFPAMKAAYVQQPLDYGPHSRYGDKWRISCYMVVMENWKPKIEPHEPMVECMTPAMNACTDAFAKWYCCQRGLSAVEVVVMNAFVTRYRAVQDEDQLKRHIDGANVDGSVVLALPTDDPFQGGALHVWDGKPQRQVVYPMRPGDALFLENAVWHQAKPITSGTRWALVLFLKLHNAKPQG